MCGIVGLINFKNRELLSKMNSTQIHRGPDYGGEFWDEDYLVGLAMRRLSIVDLNNGLQPMRNENGRIVLVFNGEIFNAPLLRTELEKKGHLFKTQSSDTEVLVHLYEEKGIDMLNFINGMFAFAIYDMDRKIIFAARDQMGIKPFHYFYKGDQLAFSSELKSLAETGISNKELNRQSVWQYLSFQCIPAPMTVYEDVIALPAAHYLLFDISKHVLQIEKYWDCIENRKPYDGKEAELPEYVAHNITEAVERWTMSDVPLACSLSGGLDSSIIAALVSKKQTLHTYSLGFHNQEEYDERKLAGEVASMYGTCHEEIILTPEDLLDGMGEMLHALDAPYEIGRAHV